MKARGAAVLWAALPLLFLGGPLIWLGKNFASQLDYEQRIRAQQTLESDADTVQRFFNQVVGKLESLAVFVADQTAGGEAVNERRFDTFAAGLHASSPWIRAFQIVSNGVITHAYPLNGNQAAIGYDLLADPRPGFGRDVARALETGRLTITGPVNLLQGGQGIVVRKLLPRTRNAPTLLVGVVVNIDSLLAESGLRGPENRDVLLAIRREGGEVFFGPPTVFALRPVTRRMVLPDGVWEIGECPREGWPALTSRPVRQFYTAGAIIIFLLCLLVYVLAHGRADRGETVREQTEALRRELAARQQAQDELQQNYSLLQAVTEGTGDSVFAKDLNGRYQLINSAGARYLRRPPEAIIGKDDSDLFSADTAPGIRDGDRKVIESGQVLTLEERGTVAGITRIYQSTKAPWRDPHGQVIGVVGVARDVTDRNRMEEILRESERQLSLILNNVSDIIFAIAVEAGDEFRFVSVNRRFLETTGLAEGQIVGARVRDVIPAPAQALVLAKYREAIETRQTVYWEEISHYPTGRKVGIVTVVPVFDDREVCTQLVGMVHDITERTQAEEQVHRLHDELQRHAGELEQRVRERTAELAVACDRAEAADRMKSVFLATMSHELRTPLNSIIGFTGIILDGLAGPLNDEQTKQLTMVQGSARHLLALINDVLDISKIEAGELKVTFAPFDLRSAIERSVNAIRPLAEAKHLGLRAEVAPGIGEFVSDARRVEQILLNLLNNAVKFTERGDVALFAEIADGAIRLRVVDTGIGIKAADLAGLFRPFQQVDTGLSRSHEGTGLGLVICRRLAGLLGGEIRVESVPGKGSTFTVTLPRDGNPPS